MKKVCVCECVFACGVPCCHSVMQKSMREWLCMSLPRKGCCVYVSSSPGLLLASPAAVREKSIIRKCDCVGLSGK
jgi:hypothetical protein